MGYSLWDLKESEKTEHTRHAEAANSIFKPSDSSVCETVRKQKTLSYFCCHSSGCKSYSHRFLVKAEKELYLCRIHIALL